MKTTGLSFIEAVKAAEETGCKIRRASWIAEVAIFIDSRGYLRDAHDDRTGLHVDNIRAEDWEIVPDPPKTMTGNEAALAVLKGASVMRLSSINKVIYKLDCDLTTTFVFSLHKENIEATDWVIVEEGQS